MMRLQTVILSAALAAASAVSACGGRSSAETAPDSAAAMTVSPDNLAIVDTVLLRSGPGISGDLTAERQATIRAELGASVLSVLVDEGQAVRRGQLLATLDEGGVAEQFTSAKSRLTAADNSAVIARRELERARRLLAGGAVAERDVEIAERTLWTAEAELEAARATLATAERQWQKTRLTAPFTGIVARRRVSVGDIVQSGNELFEVVDPASMQLEASVPVSALAALQIGTTVDFEVSGYDERTFTGRIRRISPAVDPGTRQVRITVAIPNAGALVAGLFARGRVAIEEKRAVAVPLTAVDLRGAAPTVRRIRAGRVELVAVQLGLRDDVAGLVEVAAGLAPGDSLLTGGAMTVASGTPVLVRKE